MHFSQLPTNFSPCHPHRTTESRRPRRSDPRAPLFLRRDRRQGRQPRVPASGVLPAHGRRPGADPQHARGMLGGDAAVPHLRFPAGTVLDGDGGDTETRVPATRGEAVPGP